MSLDDFKPLFYRVLGMLNVDQEDTADKDTVVDSVNSAITVFHVSTCVASRLKSLFSFVCESLVLKATAVLAAFAANEFARLKVVEEEGVRVEVVVHALSALEQVFTYNR